MDKFGVSASKVIMCLLHLSDFGTINDFINSFMGSIISTVCHVFIMLILKCISKCQCCMSLDLRNLTIFLL